MATSIKIDDLEKAIRAAATKCPACKGNGRRNVQTVVTTRPVASQMGVTAAALPVTQPGDVVASISENCGVCLGLRLLLAEVEELLKAPGDHNSGN